jgi:DNA-binding MarR family transcriptional regulator
MWTVRLYADLPTGFLRAVGSASATADPTGNSRRELDGPASGLVSHIMNARALRAELFDAELFSEPAWDILLELYQSHLRQFRMKVSSVCAASGVPATTALRWMKMMERKGLIERCADPRVGRRIFVSLSPAAVAAMDALFAKLVAQAAALQLLP